MKIRNYFRFDISLKIIFERKGSNLSHNIQKGGNEEGFSKINKCKPISLF